MRRVPDTPSIDLASALLVVAVGTSSWNAVALGPLKVTHVALGLACVVLGVTAIRRQQAVWAPTWVWLLAGAIALTAVASVLAPVDPTYFASRYAESVPNALISIGDLATAGLAAGLEWLVVALALPLAICLAAPSRPRLVPVLMGAFTVGTAISGLVAFLDLAKLTRISAAVLGPIYWGGREAGLAVHPNHLSLGIVMALPFLVWRLARAQRWASAVLPLVATVPMLAGLLAGGSRAALAGGGLVVLLALLVEPRTRKLLPKLAAAAAVLSVACLAAIPGAFDLLWGWFRLDGGGGSDASDRIRSGLAGQAWADFEHSPLHGIGFEVLVQGHNVLLQVLASGGLLLFAGYVLAQLGFLLDAWSVDDGDSGAGRALFVSGAAFLLVGMLSNQIADVFTAVPFALVAGLCASAQMSVPDLGGAAGTSAPGARREEIVA